ncbi:zinc finger protein 675-like [Toxorhynchites rutilus septentrionalis]|uniref:zinc finger protein 675-like n=1 Tax=Toxorhynchites rutilus septentrionalis TaxID=329112 RepID=UPI0024787E04|nr:zinc finger protein 675-like [Toxorhynchites rutilus septentrionalis]
MVQCAVSGCINYENDIIGPKKRFFRFPKNRELCSLWINVCEADSDLNVAKARVCSDHFLDEDYRLKDILLNTVWSKRMLREDAVPSQLLPAGNNFVAKNEITVSERKEIVQKAISEYDRIMMCIVPGCNASNQEYLIEFPRSQKLAGRWKRAIELGTGQSLRLYDDSNRQLQQLCLAHFDAENNPGLIGYQEPCCFKNRNGEEVRVYSCRLCMNFDFRARLFATSGEIEHVSLANTIRTVMKVSLGGDDFLTRICEVCLVRVDILGRWAKETLQQEFNFRELMELASKESQTELMVKVETILSETKEELTVKATPPDDRTSIADSDDGAKNEIPAVSNQLACNTQYCSSEDDIPLSKLQKKDKKSIAVNKKVENTAMKERRKISKVKLDPFKHSKKKRGRKPTSPKPIRQEYVRHILAKKCYICNVFLEDNNELVAHLTTTHAGKIDYRCGACDKTFGKVTIFNRHLSCHDISVRPRKCHFCSLCFSAKESLKIHENREHGTNHVLPKRYKRRNKVYQCETCGKIFQNDSLLKQHDQFQHKKLPAACCKLCGRTFATKANLEKHSIVHSRERPYKCEKCPSSFKTSYALTKHTLLHQNVLPYECRYCDERFRTIATYAKHRFLNHKNQILEQNQRRTMNRYITCAICSDVFSRSIDLHKHINEIHSDQVYPYITCPECPQQFLQQQQLAIHRNIHTDQFVCNICDKRHASAIQLKDHMETHNPTQPWQCTVCLKRFSLQSNFSRHRLIHQTEKRFKCDLCEKGFSQKGQLMNHRRTHTGERPFTCPICGKSFGDQPTFYKHRKRCMDKESTVGRRTCKNETSGCELDNLF